jgi:hypothetical protein
MWCVRDRLGLANVSFSVTPYLGAIFYIGNSRTDHGVVSKNPHKPTHKVVYIFIQISLVVLFNLSGHSSRRIMKKIIFYYFKLGRFVKTWEAVYLKYISFLYFK